VQASAGRVAGAGRQEYFAAHRPAGFARFRNFDGPCFLRSDDGVNLLRVLSELGASHEFRATSCNSRSRSAVAGAGRPLDLGNSGTGLRLLAGILPDSPSPPK